MRPDVVVGVFPNPQSRPQGAQLQISVVALVKLFAVGALRPLHMPVELRRARREDKQGDLTPLALLLKDSRELAASVHLQGLER